MRKESNENKENWRDVQKEVEIIIKRKEVISLFQKLKNARKYFIHQITKKLVLENDIIVSETLKVKRCWKKRRFPSF